MGKRWYPVKNHVSKTSHVTVLDGNECWLGYVLVAMIMPVVCLIYIYINVCAHYIYCSLGAWSGSLKMLDIYPFCSCECVVEQNHSQSPCSVPRLFLSCRRHGLQETFHSHLDHKHPLGRTALKWFQPKPGCESTIGWACGSRLCISKQWPMLRRKKCLVLCLKNRVPTMNQKALWVEGWVDQLR